MQTKKRAKSVKFGGTKEEPKVKEEEKEILEPKEVDEKEERYEPADTTDEPMEVNLSEEVTVEEAASDEDASASIGKAQDESSAQEKKEKKVSVIESTVAEEPSPFGSFAKGPEEERQRKGNAWFFVMVMLIAFVIGLVCIAVVYYFTKGTNEMKHIAIPNVIAKPTPTPTETPSPTPKSVDLTAYDIEVQNGSGVTGEAAKAKTSLTTAGFSVTKTGNADNSDYTKTVIEAKKGTDEAYIKALITELKKSYAIDSNIETLKTSETADVIIIIGSTTAK